MKLTSSHYPAANIDDLATIREMVETSAVAAGGDADAVGEMVLAVNEAVCNIIIHGYQNNPGFVEVVVEQADHDLLVRLRDKAPTFDPTAVPTPDITLPLEQRGLGGMGVHMMREFTDEMVYQQASDGMNELVMVKHNVL